jgi:hypothetical protein
MKKEGLMDDMLKTLQIGFENAHARLDWKFQVGIECSFLILLDDISADNSSDSIDESRLREYPSYTRSIQTTTSTVAICYER